MKRKNLKRLVRKENLVDLGESFHTAMRKCMDSKASSIAWNVIHLLCWENNEIPNAWNRWLEFIRKNLQGQRFESELRLAMKVKMLSLYTHEEENKSDYIWYAKNDKKRYESMILMTSLECFSNSDWMGLVSYLWEELKLVKRTKK